MSEIEDDAERTKHRVGSPHQENRHKQQADIEQAIDGSSHLCCPCRSTDAAPESHQSKKVQPESKVAAAATIVDGPGDHENGKSEPHGHLAPHLEIELIDAEDPRGQIHRHEPQRDRDDRDDEGSAEEAERNDPGNDGGDVHEDPATLDPDIEVMNGAGPPEAAPPAKLCLDAIDRERR